ncbi:hypothetical protein [Sulfurovum mangrovi]|uniref:hypothetical protein n=1 Tax=Sulfurovum mangrovi TaxID=2893889 RepID=UPI001E412009|nr:hypothetical protein [Sulfurovum mangrovi]UFH59969.1 hypothetical protein LN246_03760 [Sulfurovum mangrovi]
MSENKPQLILFTIGLLLIGWLFYFVNIKDSQPQIENNTDIVKAMNPPLNDKSEHNNLASSKPQGTAEASNSNRYEAKSYKEVFKATPESKTMIERFTESEKIDRLKEESDALIAEANARIKEKNLRTNNTPPSPEELEKLQTKIESMRN